MKFLRVKALYAAASVTIMACIPVMQAQQHQIFAKHVPEIVRNGQASTLGSLDTERHLQLALSLPLRNEAELDNVLQQIYDPQSPNYHHYLTVEQFTDSFGPTQQDYNAVVEWAQAQGLQVTGTAPNRRVVNVEGTVRKINRAFNVEMKSFQDRRNGRSFHAPDREPMVDLPVPLLGIAGMDDVNPPQPHYKPGDHLLKTSGTTTESEEVVSRITGSGPKGTYLPSDMRKAYYGSGPLDGTGQTVAIFSFDGYIANDLNIYYASTGMTSNVPVNNVLVGGYSGACFGFNSNGTINYATCDDGEQILDIVNVIGMAPNLKQVLFYEGNSATSVLNRMATDNIAKVISSSWGGGDFGIMSVPIFKEFQAQGQTYLNATGDDGQFNSSTYYPPSLDPNITQVGGTNLTTTGAGGPWASETAWGGSGGGFMSGTAIPSYQQLPGVINAANGGSTTWRNAPDVAAEANYDNTTVINGKFLSGYGGTSFATPRWAGLIALANQQSVANGNGTLGFINPTLYKIGLGSDYTNNFHDITSGMNKPTAGVGAGFSAVAGYDLVTGWGSPIAATLIATLTGTKPSADYSLSAAPSSLNVVPGTSGTSTITITGANGFSGAVNLTASGLPSGVTASFSPASATSSSVLTLTASSTATPGLATVTITGTSGSLTHTTTVALTVSAAANYSLSAVPVTIIQGASGTSTVSITSLNNFSGAVNLVASGLPAGVTASFSPASATSTSTLTLTASSTATVGPASVTVTGTSGSLTHTATVLLTVVAASDYSLSTSPVSLAQGASGTSTVTITGINNFSGAVNLAVSGLPAGVTATFSPASATSSSTLTWTASSTATVGAVTFTVTGTSGNLTHSTTASLNVTPAPDYSLSASPVSIALGTSGTSTIAVTAFNNFTGAVNLSASGLPAGVTASFSPASTNSTSILTLNVASTATAGLSNITITGTSGSLTHTATLALTVPGSDYSLSATPVTMARGSGGSSTIAVNDFNGFNGAVSLTVSGLPMGVSASFSPATTSSSSMLTLMSVSYATLGSVSVTITGVSGAVVHTTTLALTVTPPPDFSFALTPNRLSIPQGGSGSGTVTVTGINGFNGSVSLSVSGLPAGVTASVIPATTTSTSVLTLTAAPNASVSSGTITITGTSGSQSHQIFVSLAVTASSNFSLSASPGSVSVAQGASASSTVSVTDISGFNGTVALTASGLPNGVTASFSPSSTATSSILTLTASSTATVGPATVTITGISGNLTQKATLNLTVGSSASDYSLAASPVSITQGSSGASTISVTDIGSFAGSVNLSVSGLPAGVTASFSPASTTGSSQLTLTASSTATTGSTNIVITGVSGSLTHTTTVALTVMAPNYSLSVSSNNVTIATATAGTATIAVTSIGGFNGAVNLTASGLPFGVSASFSSATTTSSSTLTLKALSYATVGPATITITGVSGGLVHTTTVALTVTPPPDFSFSISTTRFSIPQGSSASGTITVTGMNGFNGSVDLTVTGLPAGVTASVNPPTTSSASTLTLTAAPTALTGSRTVTITGKSGGVSHQIFISLVVATAQN